MHLVTIERCSVLYRGNYVLFVAVTRGAGVLYRAAPLLLPSSRFAIYPASTERATLPLWRRFTRVELLRSHSATNQLRD